MSTYNPHAYNPVRLIEKKRDGEALTSDEIHWLIAAFTRDDVADYQMAAWAMAVQLRGMTAAETTALTDAMAHSGDVLKLPDIGLYVDKHSTGGVGDKTSLVVVPIVAASGLPVGKMSGRGLGFSGGTLDKLEAFTGFRSDLSVEQFTEQLQRIGVVLTGQSVDLAPADGKLYALRDVTGTVPSTPLIASSIMSKKLAGGANAIVLDVKVGLGAFMPDIASATVLAEAMVDIGRGTGRRVVALLSDMNQPLGQAVGNSIEVVEALDVLRGGGPDDTREHCLTVAAYMLLLGHKAADLDAARALAEDILARGAALDKLRELIAAQGGDPHFIDAPDDFAPAAHSHVISAPESGYVAQMHAGKIGMASVALGAGRAAKGDAIDLAVGLVAHVNVGDAVRAGDPLLTLYANDEARLARALEIVGDAAPVVNEPVAPLPLFYGVVGA